MKDVSWTRRQGNVTVNETSHQTRRASCFVCVALLSIAPLLSGCSDADKGRQLAAVAPVSQTPARGSLLGKPAKPAQPPQAPPPPPPTRPDQPPPGIDRGRWALAHQVRPWESVAVEGMGINCHMKTRWANGKVEIRLALLGPRESLQAFIRRVKAFHVRFKDAAGGQINEYTVPASDFQWAPATANNGVPTMQFESSAECPFELMDQAMHWSLYWDFN